MHGQQNIKKLSIVSLRQHTASHWRFCFFSHKKHCEFRLVTGSVCKGTKTKTSNIATKSETVLGLLNTGTLIIRKSPIDCPTLFQH